MYMPPFSLCLSTSSFSVYSYPQLKSLLLALAMGFLSQSACTLIRETRQGRAHSVGARRRWGGHNTHSSSLRWQCPRSIHPSPHPVSIHPWLLALPDRNSSLRLTHSSILPPDRLIIQETFCSWRSLLYYYLTYWFVWWVYISPGTRLLCTYLHHVSPLAQVEIYIYIARERKGLQ